MATKLQQRFSKSKIWRRVMYLCLDAEAMPYLGNKRFFNNLFASLAESMPEPEIVLLLFEFLQCADITPEEQAEALKLLQLNQTALTEQQRETFYNRLYE